MHFASLLLAGALLAGDGAPLKRHEGPLEKVLAEAAEKERTVLVDFHKSAEASCGWMDREVWGDPAVAALVEGGLVLYRVEAGKGEGEALVEKFSIRKWPTLVFLDGEGNELERWEGVAGRPFLLEAAQEVVDGTHVRGLRRRVEKKGEDVALRTRLGRRLLLLSDGGGRVHLEKAVELDPKREKEATKEAASLLELLEARRAGTPGPLQAFLAKNPDCVAAAEVHRDLIRALTRKEDTLSQIPSWEFLLARVPDAEVRNGLAWSLSRNAKEPERALALVDEAIKEIPDSAAFVDTRAECLSRLGRHDEAVETEKKALSMLSPTTPKDERKQYDDHLAELEKRRAEAKK
jgi:hypothetical protein